MGKNPIHVRRALTPHPTDPLSSPQEPGEHLRREINEAKGRSVPASTAPQSIPGVQEGLRRHSVVRFFYCVAGV